MGKVITGFIAFIFVAGFVIWFISASTVRVDAGNIGILVDYTKPETNGKPNVTIMPAGQYKSVNPFGGTKFFEYSAKQQTLVLSTNSNEGEIPGDSSITCTMNGGGTIKMGFTINWQVDSQSPQKLYFKEPDVALTSTFNNDISTTIVYGALRSEVITTCSKYAWTDILGNGTNTNKDQQFLNDIDTTVSKDLSVNGIDVNQILIGDRTPDANIQAVLNAKNTADKSTYDKVAAQNEADAQVIRAKGDAAQIKIINDQLNSASKNYIQWLEVNKWDGKLPNYLSTNGNNNPIVSALSGNNGN